MLWIKVRSLPEMTSIRPSSVTGGWPTISARSLTTGIGAVSVSMIGWNGPVKRRISVRIGSRKLSTRGPTSRYSWSNVTASSTSSSGLVRPNAHSNPTWPTTLGNPASWVPTIPVRKARSTLASTLSTGSRLTSPALPKPIVVSPPLLRSSPAVRSSEVGLSLLSATLIPRNAICPPRQFEADQLPVIGAPVNSGHSVDAAPRPMPACSASSSSGRTLPPGSLMPMYGPVVLLRPRSTTKFQSTCGAKEPASRSGTPSMPRSNGSSVSKAVWPTPKITRMSVICKVDPSAVWSQPPQSTITAMSSGASAASVPAALRSSPVGDNWS